MQYVEATRCLHLAVVGRAFCQLRRMLKKSCFENTSLIVPDFQLAVAWLLGCLVAPPLSSPSRASLCVRFAVGYLLSVLHYTPLGLCSYLLTVHPSLPCLLCHCCCCRVYRSRKPTALPKWWRVTPCWTTASTSCSRGLAR